MQRNGLYQWLLNARLRNSHLLYTARRNFHDPHNFSFSSFLVRDDPNILLTISNLKIALCQDGYVVEYIIPQKALRREGRMRLFISKTFTQIDIVQYSICRINPLGQYADRENTICIINNH